jgi:glycosyltransferase involved in cell wall biosynthesis
VDLLIVGPRHFRAHEVVQAANAAGARIRVTGYVSDRQLAACYRCASAFIFPSLYEGFGTPPLEAMAHGSPVACSSAGSLPEVCGTAALFFDPLQVDSIADALENILEDSALRERLKEAGLARVAGYSWKSNAARMLDLYREIVD